MKNILVDFFLYAMYNVFNKFKERKMYPYPLFEFSSRGVYLYGICIAVGLVACLITFYILSAKMGMPEKVQDYVFFILIAGLAFGFFFAMVFQGFYNYLDDWYAGKKFKIVGEGFTVMGGLIGGAGGFLLFYFLVGKYYFKGKDKDLHKKHFNTLFRVAPICICVAHAFGRIGCLMAGCCHGAYLGETPVFGGIYMEGTTNGWGYYVPTQLYEALFLFALAGVLTLLYFKRFNPIMSVYLIGYAVWRFFIEILRTDARGAVLLGLQPSQWQSVLFILGGVALLVIYYWKKMPIFLPDDKEKNN